jgi:hypothetical protein
LDIVLSLAPGSVVLRFCHLFVRRFWPRSRDVFNNPNTLPNVVNLQQIRALTAEARRQTRKLLAS